MVTDTRIVQRVAQTDDGLPADLHPVLKRIYLARDVREASQTDNSLKRLLPYNSLKNISQAVALLVDALQTQQRLLIIGDYDADGATSSALAVRALRRFGAAHVEFLVPNRFEYGYGLTPEIVAVACTKQPDMIITVDNGIASVDGVKAAKAAGIKVLITDHHLPGRVLPDADAIVNPNQDGDGFPSKHLAGVGVIFYVMAALRARLRELDWFAQHSIAEPSMAEFLDLVALGTVADVVKLDHNNRILVAQGLARMRAGQACAGILALLRVAGRDPRQVNSQDMGFRVGPRLNAAGRLDDMSIGIHCLLTDNMDEALDKAALLDNLNHERRQIEHSMREQAEQQLTKLFSGTASDEQLPAAICLFDPAYHEGVIGILAGRIKDQLHRPVIVFADSSEGMIKGSARSIPGLHIRDALDRVATAHPGLLSKFGGHAMAAGLSLRREDFERFREIFARTAAELLSEDDLQRIVHSDGCLSAQDITLDMAELLTTAGPWGQGFPEPQFHGRFELQQRRVVAEHHLKLVLRNGDQDIDAIAFRTSDQDWPQQVSHVQLVYRLEVNEFNGRRTPQLLVEHIEPVSE